MRRLLRWLLIGIASPIVLTVLLCVEENWRGRHAWEKYRRAREAKGDSFDWPSIIPPAVPDDQNFAATPLFTELFPKPPTNSRLGAVKCPDCKDGFGNWREGRADRLENWARCFTNDDVLAALSKYEPILHEVEQSSRRVESRATLQSTRSCQVADGPIGRRALRCANESAPRGRDQG
jgi:hypothetical protein